MYTHTHTYRLTYPLGTTLVSAGLANSEGRYKLQEDIPEDNISNLIKLRSNSNKEVCSMFFFLQLLKYSQEV